MTSVFFTTEDTEVIQRGFLALCVSAQSASVSSVVKIWYAD
jgi:hypothetical protein